MQYIWYNDIMKKLSLAYVITCRLNILVSIHSVLLQTVLAFSLVTVQKTENISAYTLHSYKYSVILWFMQINGLLITWKIACYVKPVGSSTNLK